MKTTKRLLSCLLVLAMMFALAIPAFADDGLTLTINNAAKDETYYLYKAFNTEVVKDAEGKIVGYSYKLAAGDLSKVPEKAKTEFEKYFVIDTAGNVTQKANTTIVDEYGKLTQDVANALLGVSISVDWGNEENGQVVFEGLSAGYYIVSNGDGAKSWLSVDTVTGSQTIFDKNSTDPTKPGDNDRYKMIVLDNGDTTNQVAAEIGESVNFRVEFVAIKYVSVDVKDNDGKVVDKNVKPVKTYTVADIATNMKVDLTKATVKVDGTPIANTEWSVDTVAVDGKDQPAIIIPWEGKDYKNNAVVTIEYSAVITADNATNDAKVGYTYDGGTGTTPDPDPDPTKVFTGNIFVHKVDGDGKDLAGATFALKNSDGKYYKFHEAVEANPDEGIEAANAYVEWVDKLENATKYTSSTENNAGAMVTFAGLKPGEYKLVETAAPAGYNGLAEEREVEIITNDRFTDWIVDADEEVINLRGVQLPSTGGIGTTMFYVIGGILVAAAVVVLVSKKRMGAEQ